MQLIRICEEELKKAGIPFSKATLYKWHSLGKHPEIFVRLGRKTFIVKEKFDKWVESEIKKSEVRAKKSAR